MSKIILFVSAFVPMYILFEVNLVVEIINNNLHFNITNTCVLLALFLLTLIGFFGLIVIIKNNHFSREEIVVVSMTNLTDQHFLNYFSLFVLLALTFDLSKICFVCVFVIILVFIGIVYIRNNIFYINPLLNILGYSFYDIEYVGADNLRHEIRIFHKGKIQLNDRVYKLSTSSSNLNFLE